MDAGELQNCKTLNKTQQQEVKSLKHSPESQKNDAHQKTKVIKKQR